MNKSVKILASCAIVVSMAAVVPVLAEAAPFHGNHRAAVQTLTPEKQAAYNNIMEESYKKMLPLHDQIQAKEMTLRALSPNPNTKPEQITALVDEIMKLRQQVRVERDAHVERIQKEVGIDMPRGFGMGRGAGKHMWADKGQKSKRYGFGRGCGFDGREGPRRGFGPQGR